MKTRIARLAVAAVVAATALVAPAGAQAATSAPYCGIHWGSLAKSGPGNLTSPITNVRAGRHQCFDRMVVDFSSGPSAFSVRYVSAVLTQGRGSVLPLRGGAFLEIVLQSAPFDLYGNPTYRPANPVGLVNVTGYSTFRQIADGGTQERYTTIGLGVRAHLPFRVFTLAGPGSHSRLVIDVAHRW